MVFSTLNSVGIKMGVIRGHFMLLFISLAQWVSKVTLQDLSIAGCPITPVRLAVLRRTDMVLGTWTEAISTNSDVILADRSHIPGEAMFPVGYTDVIYTFRNTVTGEEGICNFTFVVFWARDDQPPQIQGCPQDITRITSSSFTTVSVSWSIPTAIDNAGPVRLQSKSHDPPFHFPIGTTAVMYTFEDTRGLQATCEFNVNIIVDTPPVVECGQDIVRETPIFTGGLRVNFAECTATDDSGTVILVSRSHTPGQFFAIGRTAVTYTFSDPTGNTELGTFNIIVKGVDPPLVVACGQDIVRETPFSTGGLRVNFTECTPTDDSGTAILVSRSHTPGQFFVIGTTVVTYTFTDPSGNTGTGSFTITVNGVDDEPPVVVCGPDIVRQTPVFSGGLQVNFAECTATDDSGTVILVSRSHTSGQFFVIGTTVVTYTFTDPTGNVGTGSFTITVNGDVVITCPDDGVGVPIAETGVAIGVWSDPGCTGGVSPLSTSCTPLLGSVIGIGDTQVVCTCMDSRGTSDECNFTLSVRDDVSPVVDCSGEGIIITAPVGASGTTVANLPRCRATDNSGQADFVSQNPPQGFFPIGVTEVTVVYRDPSGNIGVGFFTVTVQGTPGVAITCPDDGAGVPQVGTGDIIGVWSEPGCIGGVSPLSTSCTPPLGSVIGIGGTQVVCNCTDSRGTSDGCDFIISVANPCDNSRCLNGGVCTALTLTDSTCVCTRCFTGPSCQISAGPCRFNRCENGGTCQPLQGSCQASVCNCPPCYTGLTCQTRVGACRNHKCQNGAVCIPASLDCDQYTCQCPSFFVGDFCQIAISNPCDSSPCLNGGQCFRSPNSSSCFFCTCNVGFSGDLCEQVVNVLENPCNNFPCLNQGSCISFETTYKCICRPGFLGRNCQQTVGSALSFEGCSPNSPCQNGGTCFESYTSTSGLNPRLSQYICICNSGFTGERCAIPVNQAPQLNRCLGTNICQNGGTCRNSYCSFQDRIDFLCECPIGFIGEVCSIPYGNPCSTLPCGDGGVCQPFNQYFVCSCLPGYSGITCDQISTDACNPNPCQNGGNCQIINGRFLCICPSGFTGQTCTQATGACNSNPCQNGGNCRIIDGRFSCICPSGFTGQTCTQRFGGVDVIPPNILNCPGDTTISFSPGVNFVAVSWIAPTAEDESPPIEREQNHVSPAFLERGQTLNVIYEFTDRLGNTATCSFFFFSNEQ
ncbi:Hyalin [Holothuria leucospilota]|uniref:Hyalin n=1 Tax=Holothuria leucospilota TaxID=206669 RepID=A0A9Q1CB63_HOLLE|nr:Hyalin [Holothuria leucospilota]